ncbi:hypothetical protein GOOTI_239_00460 [Gordonia otitidis NBRC 100426]|uniref:HNH nuclease domain-containing protein n=1 Tax=Gordonia otitidis (strain DSM 44809 / CCUG 52243 / JCM 12355 / NBRC 100426 / IFM 10032) TaxID=1108044 RepID=H5TTJ1_GORO1|nr:hypothetical protein GOOTI_239_00460 [Gordonia otitidis NBRC 100426]
MLNAPGKRERTRPRRDNSWSNDTELRRQTVAHFGTACAYYGLDVPQIIEAAHLVADSQGGAASVDSMRPMCPSHHRAYDAGLLVWDAAGGRFEPAPGAAQVAPLRAGSSAVQ